MLLFIVYYGQQIKGLDLDKEREVIRGKEDSISPAQNAADRRMAFRQGAVSQDNKKGYKKEDIFEVTFIL